MVVLRTVNIRLTSFLGDFVANSSDTQKDPENTSAEIDPEVLKKIAALHPIIGRMVDHETLGKMGATQGEGKNE